jgi:hypothetical protein
MSTLPKFSYLKSILSDLQNLSNAERPPFSAQPTWRHLGRRRIIKNFHPFPEQAQKLSEIAYAVAAFRGARKARITN